MLSTVLTTVRRCLPSVRLVHRLRMRLCRRLLMDDVRCSRSWVLTSAAGAGGQLAAITGLDEINRRRCQGSAVFWPDAHMRVCAWTDWTYIVFANDPTEPASLISSPLDLRAPCHRCFRGFSTPSRQITPNGCCCNPPKVAYRADIYDSSYPIGSKAAAVCRMNELLIR